MKKLPQAFGLFALAVSSVVASRLAHGVLYHGVHVVSLKAEVGLCLLLLVMVCLAPLMVFIPTLVATKKQALLEYGTLVVEHGRLVHRRWILGETIEAPPLLMAPEIGPVADAVTLYEAVANMRLVPIGKSAVVAIALPAGIPLLALLAIEIPIRELLMKLMSTLA